MTIQGNSSFLENRADVGGAIYNSKRLDISDTSFLNNTASGSGGVIFADVDLTTYDLSGPGLEASLGVNAKITDAAYLYGALTLETGKAYSSYLFNAGLRVKF